MNKTIFVIAGSIGSGKTTFAVTLLSNPIFQDVEFISADIYVELFFDITDNIKHNHRLAKKFMLYKQMKLIQNGESFIWEMVPSKKSKFDILEKAKADFGYKIVTFYINTDNVDVNRKRVEKRMAKGGTTVFDSKVVSRFEMCVCNLPDLERLSDEMYYIDNSVNICE